MKRYGKKRGPGCTCDASTTCRVCLQNAPPYFFTPGSGMCEDIGCAVDFADEGGAGPHPRHEEATPSPLESSPDAAAEWSIDAAMAERAELDEPPPAPVRGLGERLVRARGFCPSCGRRIWSWVPDLAGWRETGRHGAGCYDLVGYHTATPDELGSLQGPDEGGEL